jgi:hypothetical protein
MSIMKRRRTCALAIALVLSLFAFGPLYAAPAAQTTTAPNITGFRGVQEGQSVSGRIAIEALVAGSNISRVRFDLNGPTPARHTERRAPYTFRGDSGWDTTAFLDGSYTLDVTATNRVGEVAVRSIRFSIANRVKQTTVPTPAAPQATIAPPTAIPPTATSTALPMVTATATPAPAPPATQPGVIWSANHETGDLSQWTENDNGAVWNSGSGVASVTDRVAHSGRYAAQLTITGANNPGGDPQAVRIFRYKESQSGQPLYYSAWYYFPQTYTPQMWWNIFQFKSKSSTRNDAFWQLNVGNRADGKMYLYMRNWVNSRGYDQKLANLPVNTWTHIEVYYKQGIGDGHITVWQDGVQLFDLDGITTRYADSYQSANWSLNNYTDAILPSDATIYVDDVAISTTRVGR